MSDRVPSVRLAPVAVVMLLLLGASCTHPAQARAGGPGADAPPNVPAPASDRHADGDAQAAAALLASLPPLPPVRNLRSDTFGTSRTCGMCHSNTRSSDALRDAAGRPVAPFDLWRSSMMANAMRDPLFRAAVSVERAATPALTDVIEHKCLSCHAPMAEGRSLAELGIDAHDRWLRDDGGRTSMALDGVSCSVCHQIQPDNLGTPQSFNAGFTVGDQHVIYGPHPEPFAEPMRNMAGWEPTEGRHVLESALCATCHTLFTDAHHADGTPVGSRLPEQMAYLEWRNSVYDTERDDPLPMARSCQTCHMPQHDVDGVAIATRLARHPMGRDFPPLRDRQPFGRHVFVGGNTLVPAMLRDHGEVLGAQAPPEAFAATRALALDQLEQRSARLSTGEPTHLGGLLRLPVNVVPLTGHKLPTGHPTRRVWLRAVVRDAAGRVLTSVGEHDDQGRIVGMDGVPLPAELRGGPVYPHRQTLRPDAPQVWQSLMADAAGEPTWLLLRGARYLKDDRLLPRGWSATHADAEHTAPAGVAGDEDFTGGSDGLLLELPVPDAAGPLRVELSLLYQTLGARWAAELLAYDTPQVREFAAYWALADRTPVTLARLELTVP